MYPVYLNTFYSFETLTYLFNYMESTIGRVLIAGSGSNGLLLTGSTGDLLGFHPVDLTPYEFVQLKLGGMFAIGINSKGQPLVWGTCAEKIITIPRILSLSVPIVNVSCGWNHSVFISADHTLFGVGENKFGMLTSKNQAFFEEPIEIPFNSKPEKVCCGFRQTYVLDSQNKLFGRGQNKNAQLGSNLPDISGWNLIGTCESKIMKVNCGKRFVAALDQKGNIWGCGNNQYKVFKNLPTSINQLSLAYQNVVDFATGWNHLVMGTKQGKVKSFGLNTLGQLGHGQDTDQVSFEQKQCMINPKLTSGTQFTFCQDNQGVYGWGWNQHSNITSSKVQIVHPPVKISESVNQVITYGAVTILI